MTGRKNEVSTNNVVSLDAERDRHKFIALAHADWGWLEAKASMALSGFVVTDEDAELCGRIIAGAITYEQACEEINAQFRGIS
jgi:hypothetical protein